MRVKISEIRKRDGRIVKFNPDKIKNAIRKAMVAVKKEDEELAERLSRKVVSILEEDFEGKIPNVEDVQNLSLIHI